MLPVWKNPHQTRGKGGGRFGSYPSVATQGRTLLQNCFRPMSHAHPDQSIYTHTNQAVIIRICTYDVNALLDVFSLSVAEHYTSVTVPVTYQPTYQPKSVLRR